MIDYDEIEQTPDDASLKLVAHLAKEQKRLEVEVLEAETKLKDLSKQLNEIQFKKLPEAMQEAGLTEFVTKDGFKITIKDDIKMSIPKKNMEEISAWLVEQNLESLLKTHVGFDYDKGESDKVNDLIEFLTKNGLTEFSLSNSVNTSSVKAALKELKENGVDIPYKLLGAYEFSKSVLK